MLACASLFGLWLLLKYLPDLSLQTFLDAYFFLLGSAAIWGAARPLLRRLPGGVGQRSLRVDVPDGWLLDEQGKEIRKVRFAPSDVVAGVLAVGLAGAELASHHSSFTLNNMVACLVATEILALLGLRSFRAAALLLSGMLAYDVFAVFGSSHVVGENVMLEVATSDAIVGPMRLLFPRNPGGIGDAADFPYSLLGLGDVALPGLLAGLALRFDAFAARTAAAAALGGAAVAAVAIKQGADSSKWQHQQAVAITSTSSSSSEEAWMPDESALESRPMFKRVVAAHIVGLLGAFAANSITHLGQPALLYIVPAMLGTVFATAAAQGQLSDVWSWTDRASFGMAAAEGAADDKQQEQQGGKR